MRAAIYAGSFDPVTNGHLDLIERGSRLFDRLTVAVASNIDKSPVFSPQERVEMIETALAGSVGEVDVCSFDGLIVEFARQRGATCLLRGIRSVSDLESEHALAMTNRDLADEIETVFLMPSLAYSYVSSRLIREAVKLGADVSHLIPAFVQDRLRARLSPKESR